MKKSVLIALAIALIAVVVVPLTGKAEWRNIKGIVSLNSVQVDNVIDTLDGVECLKYATELDISYHRISMDVNSFVTEIEKFPALKKLIMCDCGYTNEDMEFLMEKFPDIKFVWRLHFANKWSCRTDAVAFSTLQPKEYTTTMNSADAAQFKYCTEMQCLDIGHNRVTDLSFLQYMPDLRIFILHANYDRVNGGKVRDISYLKYCPKLQYLEIFKTDVSDLSVFQYLPNLKDIYASTTPISDITYLMNLPKLERLFIQDTKISNEDYLILKERYPDADILYYGNLSVWDNGWRNHARYYGMRRTIRNNALDELFEDYDYTSPVVSGEYAFEPMK